MPSHEQQSRPWTAWLCLALLFAETAMSSPYKIMTGFYGTPAKVQIQDHKTGASWVWDAKSNLGLVPADVQSCIQNGWSATEVKIAAQGKKIAAIIGNAAVIINHTPGEETDKTVSFAVCLNGELGNAHTVELLPGNQLAVATSGQSSSAGVWVYDASKLVAAAQPTHKMAGVRAIHGLLWDQEGQMLWAAGNTDAANGSGGTANGTVQGYKYDLTTKRLTESTNYTMPFARRLDSEWEGDFAKWWDGPHDLIPVPSTRILLFPMDRDVHAIDLSSGQFNHSGAQLAADYLPGFHPLGNRTGYDGEKLPRSDIKSISLHPHRAALYVQAPWRASSGLANQVNLLGACGTYKALYQGQTVYRSRWFMQIPGWPTA